MKQKNNLWKDLSRPIFVQAPMEDVTDTVFRQMIAYCGVPGIFYTEFTNVDGIFSTGARHVTHRLTYTEEERPIIAQIWGEKPGNYYKAGKYLRDLGFDGIDINMGCPQKSVMKKGLCAGLIDNHNLAHEIIRATQEGAGDLPVSVKTRIGIRDIQTEDWIGFLLDQELDALIIHGRTVKEMSSVPAHWDEIGKAAKLRDSMSPETVVIGNGDIKTRKDAHEKIQKYNIDGVMIARGIFDNIYIFNTDEKMYENLTVSDRLQLLRKHIMLFDETWGKKKPMHVLKKYYKIYIKDFPNARDMRVRLMGINSTQETLKAIDEELNKYQ